MKTMVLIELDLETWWAIGSVENIQKAIDLYLTPIAAPAAPVDNIVSPPTV